MSQISTAWRECSIMTLLTIHWVPVQDKGSKILCVKLGTLKITPSDCLHQEYLTMNLGSSSDWLLLKLPLVRLFGRWRGRCRPAGAAWGRESRRRSSVLLLNLSDTAATSQDELSLEFIAAIAAGWAVLYSGSGRGLCSVVLRVVVLPTEVLPLG
jgi:hypothetical protein